MFHATNNTHKLEQCSQGATLMLPAVATGNVPQLTVDLLLSSLPHTLLGCFHSSHVLPAVGGDALATEARRPTGKKAKSAAASATAAPVLTTSMQLFFIPSLSLLVMQQRAPAIRGRHRALVSELLAFARSLAGLRQTVLLTSSLAYRKADEELDAVHPVSFYYLPASGEVVSAPAVSASATSAADCAPSASPVESLLRATLGWNSLHHSALQQDEQPAQYDQLNSAEEVEDALRVGGSSSSSAAPNAAASAAPVKPIPVPGLGITRPFFEMVSEAAAAAQSAGSASSSSSATAAPLSFPSLCLHVYVNEGANDRDAMIMAQSVYTMLFMQRQQLQQQSASSAPAADADGGKQAELADPRHMIWCPPGSWKAVFGNEAEETLYL